MSEEVETIFVIIAVCVIFGLISYFVYESQKSTDIRMQNEIRLADEKGLQLESHKFYLKEMSTDTLIGGKFSGGFLLASGSIYGEISENNYLNVVYFDDDTIIDNITDVYRITKFNLNTIEIVTITKNETPYYKYVRNTHQSCDFEEGCFYKFVIGTPRLYLPDGWAILNNK